MRFLRIGSGGPETAWMLAAIDCWTLPTHGGGRAANYIAPQVLVNKGLKSSCTTWGEVSFSHRDSLHTSE